MISVPGFQVPILPSRFASQSGGRAGGEGLAALRRTDLPWVACERNLPPELVLDASFDVLRAAAELCPLAAAGLFAHARLVAALALLPAAPGDDLALRARAVLDAAREARLLLAAAGGGSLRARRAAGALALSGRSAPAPLVLAADLALVTARCVPRTTLALVATEGDPAVRRVPHGDPRAAGAALFFSGAAVPAGLHLSAGDRSARALLRLSHACSAALAPAVPLGAARRALAELRASSPGPASSGERLGRALLALDAAEAACREARARVARASRPSGARELAGAERLARAAGDASRRAAHSALSACARLAPLGTQAAAEIAACANALGRWPLLAGGARASALAAAGRFLAGA